MRSDIERQVMASVGVIYVARKLASRAAIAVYMLLASAVAVARFASVPHVLANMRAVGFSGFFDFVLVAMLKTHLAVQLAILLGVAAVVMLAMDFLRPHLHAGRVAY